MKEQSRENAQEGSALLIVALFIMMLSFLALLLVQGMTSRSRATLEDRASLQALAVAETGIALKLQELDQSSGTATGAATYHTACGQAQVSVTVEGDALRIVSRGTSSGANGSVTRGVEVYLRAQFHPFFYKATYVGNQEEVTDYTLNLGPDDGTGTTAGGGTWDERRFRHRNTRLSERDLQIDLNNDGDLEDKPKLLDLYRNRRAWGWDPPGPRNTHIQRHSRSRSYYRLDIDKSGSLQDRSFQNYQAPTVTVPPEFRDPSGDVPQPEPLSDWDTTSRTNDADYLEGDVYVNGDTNILGRTNIFGDVDATGTVQGSPVTGTATSDADSIPPPDLAAMDYGSLADVVVSTGAVPNWMMSQKSSSYYGGDLGPSGSHDNPHFHLGTQSGAVPVSDADGILVLVKGNLWLHTTSSFTIDLPRSEDVRMTVVVEGNLYVADDLDYGTSQSGILFIVKGNDDSPESFIDTNRNYRHDPGEQLINDDGDGVYEGPVEGQGNVYFGDPRFGTGGVTDGFIYAQNNVYMVNPPKSVTPPQGQDAIFGVFGFLSAGGIMDLGDRRAGSSYENYRVRYDDRIERGTISFPGMPPSMGGGFNGLAVASWREIR